MTVRTSRKTVTFTRPFSLSGIEVQPAGTYTVETDEELLPGLSFPAYRRIASLIFLRSRGGGPVVEEVASVDPLELQAAQERDAGLHTLADYHSGYLDQNDGQRILKFARVHCAGSLDLLILRAARLGCSVRV